MKTLWNVIQTKASEENRTKLFIAVWTLMTVIVICPVVYGIMSQCGVLAINTQMFLGVSGLLVFFCGFCGGVFYLMRQE